MKTLSILTTVAFVSTVAFSFDFSGLANDVLKANTTTDKPTTATTATTKTSTSSLSDATVTSGLKEALKVGVDFGVKALSQKNGYLDNADVTIPLPDKLAKAETLIRKVGGDKIADDLIHSMNSAATEAAPKTATIFVDAVDKMSIEDAKNILAGGSDAATQYFQKNTSTSLKNMIKPIIQKSMADNNVAQYYDTFNEFYTSNIKGLVENNSMMSMAKSFGADEYLPSESDAKLDDFVTQKAIDGLFKMIANKEAQIRKDPVAQTTSLLKKVFGN
jgi:hypothetical protein